MKLKPVEIYLILGILLILCSGAVLMLVSILAEGEGYR